LKECSISPECFCCKDGFVKTDPEGKKALKPFPLHEPIECVEDLTQWFHQFFVPEDQQLVGVEVEKLGVVKGDWKAIPYSGDSGLETILRRFEEIHGWEASREGDHIIKLSGNGCFINLEPGGQFEISGSPVRDLHAVWNEQVEVTRVLNDLSSENGFVWLGYGIQPFSTLEEIEWTPKGRYGILSEYLRNTGKLAHKMMKQTASIQVSFNYVSEEDALGMMRLALILSPIATAMFANSPVSEGKLNGYRSKRSHIWAHTDPSRSGLVREVLKEDSRFSDYVDYALSVPLLFIVRDGKWVKMEHVPFREYLERGQGDFHATFCDWDLHLTTLFPEVRLKNVVEVRCADGQRPSMIMTVPAFWKGLLYDRHSCRTACDVVKDITLEDLDRLMAEVPAKALGATLGNGKLLDRARDLIELSREGLIRQGEGEESFLDPLVEFIIERGITPAEEVIRGWETGWNKDPEKFIALHSF
jgi:glutamate--cysteine ligase